MGKRDETKMLRKRLSYKLYCITLSLRLIDIMDIAAVRLFSHTPRTFFGKGVFDFAPGSPRGRVHQEHPDQHFLPRSARHTAWTEAENYEN